MKCVTSVLVLLVALAPTLELVGQDKDKMKETPLFPLKVGSKWYYKAGDKQALVQVVKLETMAGWPCARVTTTSGGQTSTEHLSVRDDGVYRVANENVEVKPPLRFLKLPAKKGDSWDVKSMLPDFPFEGKFTVGEEEVTVPAGKFKAVTVSSDDFKVAAAKMKMTTWFAPDVGMVKQHLQVGDTKVLIELEKFEFGAK